MLVVGLTGGIASGKSTISSYLGNHGFPIIDADLIARQVVEPGKPAYNNLVAHFQQFVPDLLQDDGTLNRGALGSAVFGQPDRLKVLNGIVHGAVKKEIFYQILQVYLRGKGTVILDVPLLFESGLNYVCGKIVTVSTEPEIQLERLLKRNPELSDEDGKKRINSQLASEERNRRADIVIENNGNLEEFHAKIDLAITKISPFWPWTIATLFPPIGIFSAILTIAYCSFKDYRKRSLGKKKD